MGFYFPGMKSPSYWRERMRDRDRRAKISEDKLIAKVNEYYRKAFNDITKELNNFYIKYATDNSITIAEAKQLLTPLEYADLLEQISTLKESFALTGSEYTLEEMQLLSDRKSITRLQALLDSIDTHLIKTTHNVQISIEDHLSKMYQRSYKEALKDVGANNSEVINHRAVKDWQTKMAGTLLSAFGLVVSFNLFGIIIGTSLEMTYVTPGDSTMTIIQQSPIFPNL